MYIESQFYSPCRIRTSRLPILFKKRQLPVVSGFYSVLLKSGSRWLLNTTRPRSTARRSPSASRISILPNEWLLKATELRGYWSRISFLLAIADVSSLVEFQYYLQNTQLPVESQFYRNEWLPKATQVHSVLILLGEHPAASGISVPLGFRRQNEWLFSTTQPQSVLILLGEHPAASGISVLLGFRRQNEWSFSTTQPQRNSSTTHRTPEYQSDFWVHTPVAPGYYSGPQHSNTTRRTPSRQSNLCSTHLRPPKTSGYSVLLSLRGETPALLGYPLGASRIPILLTSRRQNEWSLNTTQTRSVSDSVGNLVNCLLPTFHLPSIMALEVVLATQLTRDYPAIVGALESKLESITSPESDFVVYATLSALRSFKTITWKGVHGLAALLWLDASEALPYLTNIDSLSHLIDSFRLVHGQIHPYDRTWIIIYRLHDDHATPVSSARSTLEELQETHNTRHHFVNDLDEAAAVVVAATRDLLFQIANPTLEQQADEFKRMLLVIPGMDDDRVEIVCSRYPSLGALWRAFGSLEQDIQAGRVSLNASLFSDSTPMPGPPARWVYNLYRTLMGTDPEEKLYCDETD
ncbi:hypothetical protein PM082_002387 [Marasmius tenuissimus]|nr:hypothetical protein PM082_002387 [Marasmius tenuissimus]